MIQNIHLHGALGRRFGRLHELDVATPAEAVQALSVLRPGFAEAIREGTWRVVRGSLKRGRRLREADLGINLGGEMHILAAPRGSGGGSGQSTAKVVIGVALIAAAFWLAPAVATGLAGGAAAAPGTVAGTAGLGGSAFGSAMLGGWGISGTQVAMFGAAMAFAGASQLLSPVPKPSSFSPQDTKASFLFSGALNSPDQGVPVPLAFGRCRVGGVLVSVSYDTEDVPV